MFDISLSKLAEDIEWRTNYFKNQLDSLNEKLDEICSKDETFAVYFAQMSISDDLDNKIKNYDKFFRGKKKEMKEKSIPKENKQIAPGFRYLNNAFTFEYNCYIFSIMHLHCNSHIFVHSYLIF